MTHTTINLNHYVYSVNVTGYDRITGEAIPRVVCSCGKAFILRHTDKTPDEMIASHAEMAALR